MASVSDLLVDAFERVNGVVHQAVEGLDEEALAARLDAEANSIAWLVWHLARIQDDHVSEAAGVEQQWTVGGWSAKFDLPLAPVDTGYGHSPQDVATVRVSRADLLTGYHDAVHAQTVAFVAGVSESDLDRVVDESWDPPVTLGVRIVSVLSDTLQHAGQAAFVRGVLARG
ncbi:MAG: hypothetical protein QOE01_1835 [Actinomycetota bacterium]|nr:hypothetical protein [Actinomycetota bacterium]